MKLTRRQALASGAAVLATTIAKPAIAAKDPIPVGYLPALTGYLRFPESAGPLSPAPDRDKRLWFVRDHLAMAKVLGWGVVAPFYIDLETPVPQNAIPRPGPLQVHLKDDHLQYAITWFTLAFALVIAFGVWWRRRA